MANYNKCPNGHYYDASLKACPYCSSNGSKSNGNGSSETMPYDDLAHENTPYDGKTRPYNDFNGGETQPIANGGDGRTMPFNMDETDDLEGMKRGNNDETVDINEVNKKKVDNPILDKSEETIFFDEKDVVVNGKQEKIVVERSRRKIVGWLITYTLDPMGVDYRLYEGKNILGHDPRVQITIQDPAVSSTQATIRYLNGKFAIRDEMSSHGTYVNGESIELSPVYLNDGDEIRVGHTTLKFRTAM